MAWISEVFCSLRVSSSFDQLIQRWNREKEKLPSTTPTPCDTPNSCSTSEATMKNEIDNQEKNRDTEGVNTLLKMDEIDISPIHALSLSYNLYHLYQNAVGTDVTIQCDNELFQVHSFVLCHASPYFKQMLHGIHPAKDLINLDEKNFLPTIEKSALKHIIESSYTGIIDHLLNKDNATSILVAAHHLQFHHAYDSCANYMLRTINHSNCLSYWLSGRVCNSIKIKEKALGIIGRHFEIIHSTRSFLGLKSQTLIDLLLDDSLHVPNEMVVYEATMAWIKHDLPNREGFLNSLLDVRRMSYLPAFYLINVVGQEDLIQHCNSAFNTYSKAIKLKLGDDNGNNKDDQSILLPKKRHHFLHGIVGKVERMIKKIDALDFDSLEHERLQPDERTSSHYESSNSTQDPETTSSEKVLTKKSHEKILKEVSEEEQQLPQDQYYACGNHFDSSESNEFMRTEGKALKTDQKSAIPSVECNDNIDNFDDIYAVDDDISSAITEVTKNGLASHDWNSSKYTSLKDMINTRENDNLTLIKQNLTMIRQRDSKGDLDRGGQKKKSQYNPRNNHTTYFDNIGSVTTKKVRNDKVIHKLQRRRKLARLKQSIGTLESGIKKSSDEDKSYSSYFCDAANYLFLDENST